MHTHTLNAWLKKPLLTWMLGLAGLSLTASAHAQWSAAWQAPQGDAFLSLALNNTTVREIITPHAGGARFRVRLSNLYGTQPVQIGAASVGISAGLAALAGPPVAITFNGSRQLVLPPGQSQYSDPIDLPIDPMQRLAVSLHVANAIASASRHFTGNEYLWTAPGDQSGNATGQSFKVNRNALLASTLIVDRMDVQATAVSGRPARVVALFGDSITDGFMAELGVPLLPSLKPIGQDVRYPDFLQRRALAEGVNATFVSAALSGNRLLSGPFLPMFGPAGRHRLDRDVLSLPGVTDALILIGINDLGFSVTPTQTGAALADGLADAIARLHAAKVRVTVGTLLPSGGASFGLLHGSVLVDAARQKLNQWIQTSGVPDAVVDFDACVRNPAAPSRLLPAFDSSDHLHPSAAGYAAMANCVDLGLFR